MKYFFSLLTVALTFAFGYIVGNRNAGNQPALVSNTQEQKIALKAANTARRDSQLQNVATAEATEAIPTSTRLRVLASLKRHSTGGLAYRCTLFGGGPEKMLSDEFIYVFGLNADEVSILSIALKNARTSIMDIQKKATTAQFDPDRNVLSVAVPAVPDQSGPAYDQAYSVMTSVLGPERMQYFNMLSAEDFELAFTNLSLMSQNIAITPDPVSKGEQLYLINDISTSPGGGTTTSSSSGVNRKMMGIWYPIPDGLLDQYFKK
jgi:hypothetical protein